MTIMNTTRLFAVGLLALGLTACAETDTGSSASASMDAPLRTGSAEDENACLSAVAQQTGNTVSLISSDFSEANTIVMVGVGPDRAPWKCLVSDARVAEVMSMTDEGSL